MSRGIQKSAAAMKTALCALLLTCAGACGQFAANHLARRPAWAEIISAWSG